MFSLLTRAKCYIGSYDGCQNLWFNFSSPEMRIEEENFGRKMYAIKVMLDRKNIISSKIFPPRHKM